MTYQRPLNPIFEFFKKFHGYEPSKELSELAVAKKIIEVFGNRDCITAEEEKKCVDYIRYRMPCTVDEKIRIILSLEDFKGASALMPAH